MASKEFLIAGIRSIQYKNGARVNIASYSEMAVRTAKVRAQAMAQGAVMDDWGEHLVKVKRLGSTCELCAPWQGRVLIDDVWASGTSAEGDYPMVSSAVREGLGHPNCRHLPIDPWLEGVNEPEKVNTPEENAQLVKNYEAEQRQRFIERKTREYKRLEAGSVDPVNKAKYGAKVKEWQGRMRELLADNPQLRRIPMRESASFSVSVPPKPWIAKNFDPTYLMKHVQDHIADYPGFSVEDYQNHARELLNSAVGGDIEGFTSEAGTVFRYNKATNDFATARPNGVIQTLYKPTRER